MKFWWKFLTSRNFSFDFKLANIIMRDSLRQYLAVDLLALDDILQSDKLTNSHKKKISKITKDIRMIMEGVHK